MTALLENLPTLLMLLIAMPVGLFAMTRSFRIAAGRADVALLLGLIYFLIFVASVIGTFYYVDLLAA